MERGVLIVLVFLVVVSSFLTMLILTSDYHKVVSRCSKVELVPSACNFECPSGNSTIQLYSMLLWDGQFDDLTKNIGCKVNNCSQEKILICR